MNLIWKELKAILNTFLDLRSDADDTNEIINNIEKAIEFRGTNLWILMFAIIVASVGLNVNSTAVIIGAMLISPLMGPIMGVGLGVGIYDFRMIKKSFKSLLYAVAISVITSAIYFAITPINEAQSELLARTTPTIWDVFIAFFGGLAGIVASTRKDKGNAIPGVAIATALMPPLCTAGFGIATGNLNYFLGAFYLFFINSVFISVSTILIVRFLKLKTTRDIDPIQASRMKYSVIITVLITIIPSVILGYGIVKRSFFNRNAKLFIQQEFDYPDTRIIEQIIYPKERQIEVFLFGKPLNTNELDRLNKELEDYGLTETELIVRQNTTNIDAASMRTEIVEELYRKNENLLQTKDDKIRLLELELSKYRNFDQIEMEVCQEMKTIYPEIKSSAFNTMIIHGEKTNIDTVTMVYLDATKELQVADKKKLSNWLKQRLKKDNILIVEK